MRIYIAGPMSGLPEMNYPAFQSATDRLRAGGWDVVSPHELFPPDPTLTREECLKVDLKELLTCDAIGLLPGSDKSIGAQVELSVAKAVGLTVYNLQPAGPEWIVWSNISEPATKPETILEEAQRLVHGDRGASYGHPGDDYARTGAIWGAILHEWAKIAAASSSPRAVPARLAALCMVGVKISREVNHPKRDNRVDGCGYFECVDMIDERERRGS